MQWNRSSDRGPCSRCSRTSDIYAVDGESWEGKIKGRAFSFLGLHPDDTPVTFDYLLCDRQTNPGPGVLVVGMEPLEHSEDPLGMLHPESDAVILDRKDPSFIAWQ